MQLIKFEVLLGFFLLRINFFERTQPTFHLIVYRIHASILNSMPKTRLIMLFLIERGTKIGFLKKKRWGVSHT